MYESLACDVINSELANEWNTISSAPDKATETLWEWLETTEPPK